MKALLLAGGLALAPGVWPQQEPAEQAVELSAPPKAPVAGMTGFRSKSRVVLASDPEQIFRLEAYYVFPERVRWSLIPEEAAAKQRRLYFRFGQGYWSIAPEEEGSQPLGPEAGESLLRRTEIHMELRRAAMLWPDGLVWEGDGPQKSALSSQKVPMLFMEDPQPLVLIAQVDESGRPTEIHVHWRHPQGHTLDTRMALVDITWRQEGQRWWPHAFRLVGYGETEWHETVESVDTGVNALDSFFVPPDRRNTEGAVTTKAATLVTLPPVVQRRVPLADAASWEEAMVAAARLAEEEAARIGPLGGELGPGLVLELNDAGAPQAVLLRLVRAPEILPEGWNLVPNREAMTSRRPGGGPVQASTLHLMRARLPKGAEAGVPFAKVAVDARGRTTCQVLLPFRRPD